MTTETKPLTEEDLKRRKRRRRFYERTTFVLMLLLFVVALLWKHIFISIPPGSVGVVWLRFMGGTVLDRQYGEGLRVIFPWDRMYIYNARVLRHNVEVTALSGEGLEVTLEVNVLHSIEGDNAPYLHIEVGPDYVDQLLNPLIGSAVREEIANAGSFDLLFQNLSEAIEREVQESIDGKLKIAAGDAFENSRDRTLINIVDFNIVRVTLPEAVNASIQAKMVAEQAVQRYAFTIQEERLEAERRKIEAQGIKAFQDIVSPTISDNFLKWRGIEATLALARSPNSKIVVIGGSDGLPLILDGRTDIPMSLPQTEEGPPTGNLMSLPPPAQGEVGLFDSPATPLNVPPLPERMDNVRNGGNLRLQTPPLTVNPNQPTPEQQPR